MCATVYPPLSFNVFNFASINQNLTLRGKKINSNLWSHFSYLKSWIQIRNLPHETNTKKLLQKIDENFRIFKILTSKATGWGIKCGQILHCFATQAVLTVYLVFRFSVILQGLFSFFANSQILNKQFQPYGHPGSSSQD